jgi:hypothetical protein
MKSQIASTAPWRAALLALALGASLLPGQTSYGQANPNPPERMTYQGFLVDGNGVALGNTGPKNYDVIFRIWSSESGTANNERLWSEQQTVTVDKGNFSVLLGEGTVVGSEARPDISTLFKGPTASSRFLGITVRGIGNGGANVDILPRLQLLSSPYAFLATQATKLVRSDGSADLLSSSGNVMTLSGELDIVGANTLEFGAGVTKQSDAGKIGYGVFTPGVLDIVGGGTLGNNRSVKVWAEGGAIFTGPLRATTIDGTFIGDGSALTGVAKLAANTFTGLQNIQNHVRIGEPGTGTSATAGWGEALIFSGAPPMAAFWDSDNSDPLWMARFNSAANSSELRMVIGDDGGSPADRFVIGVMAGGTFNQGNVFNPLATFDARGFLGLAGRVPDYALSFPNLLGDKICLWGNANQEHYGFGIDNGTLQIHSDVAGSAIQFGFGRFGAITETARVDANMLTISHASAPQLRLNRTSDGRWGTVYRSGGDMIVGLTGSAHDPNNFRYALYNGDANWDFPSDRKLKKDIVDAEPVLDRALQVRVRTFRWNDAPSDSVPMIGVIAQELEPVFPGMVSSSLKPESNETVKTVGYGDFAVIAIKALQEFKVRHDAEVKDLKSQINELKSLQSQVAELKAQLKDVVQAAAELRNQADNTRTTASLAK